MKSIWIVLVVGALLAACHTYQTVSRDDIAPGDWVRVLDTSGFVREFEVTSINAEAIEGWSIRVPLNEIALIEKERISVGRSILTGFGVAYLGLIVVGVVFVSIWYAVTV